VDITHVERDQIPDPDNHKMKINIEIEEIALIFQVWVQADQDRIRSKGSKVNHRQFTTS